MPQYHNSDNKQSSLRPLLQSYREKAISEQEKQKAFEKFVIAYLTEDPLQKQEYETVQSYRDVADRHGWKGSDIDTDIDLVAKIRDQNEYVAIQCKFMMPRIRLRKGILRALSLYPVKSGLNIAFLLTVQMGN
ncbi:hypothetical protein MEI_00414 [Bartonella vinsonii subsp. arupensis Pm136co]|uniref:Mrr-like domain-containing protein n=1 Tax=Bartonella vinsonii subsp. arupensis Pm136co TaxID=1094561 RepID=A0ABP2QUI0_BARVI|nr:hypothetical protein MEI_00414 [Bartonella vinsonii subsp. arupensis Pm136co]